MSTDLVTLTQAQQALADSLPADQQWLPEVVDAASAAVVAYCKRDFVQQNYVELLNGNGFSAIWTKQYPINAVTRLCVDPTAILTVANTATGLSRATAALLTTGDYYGGFTVSGVLLTTVSSGVTTTITVPISANETIASLAAAITAQGNGWQATVLGNSNNANYSGWPVSDILPVVGAQNCLNGGTALFQVHITDVSGFVVRSSDGQIRFNTQTWDPVFALMNINASPVLSVFPPGWQNIRVEYNAGYATIPTPVVEATMVTVKTLLYELQVTTHFDQERDDLWQYTIAKVNERGLPEVAKKILGPWRSFRSFS